MSATCPIAFRCPSCGETRDNPEARHTEGEYRAITLVAETRTCDTRKADAHEPIVLDDVSFDRFSRALENPRPPNVKLRALFRE